MLLLPGHTGPVQRVAYLAAEPTLISTGSDRQIRFWDIATAKEVRSFVGSSEAIYALAVSPDGNSLATGGLEGEVRVWDLASGQERFTLPGHSPCVTDLSFSPNSKTLTAGIGHRVDGSQGGGVKLWDAQTGDWQADVLATIQREQAWPQGGVWSLAFAPDGGLLGVGTGVEHVLLWDVAQERLRAILHQASDSGVRSLAFAPDGWSLAAASGYGAKVWDLMTCTERLEILGHRGLIGSIAFSPDGRTLATGSSDQTTRLWDAATGRELASYDWQAGKVHSVAFAPDGMTAAAGCESGAVVMWDVDL